MGTPCMIGFEHTPGQVSFITVNYDGYWSGAGVTLMEHYQDREKVAQLIALGDLSSLGTEIGEKQDFDRPTNRDWCCAYGRDRGEEDVEAGHGPMAEFWLVSRNYGYTYLFDKDGVWRTKETTLADKLADND